MKVWYISGSLFNRKTERYLLESKVSMLFVKNVKIWNSYPYFPTVRRTIGHVSL